MVGPSPFHQGEQLVQEKAGVRDRAEALGRRMIKDFLPGQHRQFYAQLPILFLASLDERGRPWASVVAGEPGFAHSPDPKHLDLQMTPPPFDPGSFKAGTAVGMLGLEFETRRRNRLNGRIVKADPTSLSIEVEEAFGNCPQFIQTRRRRPGSGAPARRVAHGPTLDSEMVSLIENSDTFLIASVFEQRGLDLSHRGGRAGFIKVTGERTLLWPDFSGNNHFNTLGNIAMDSRTGYLFFDLHQGVLLYLTGHTTIHWDHPDIGRIQGAQRMLKFELEQALMVADSLPFRWDLDQFSPALAETGTYRSPLSDFEIVAKVRESEQITSFHLRPSRGKAMSFLPGQHVAIEFGRESIIRRSYSLSDSPGKETLRISVKRESLGQGSRYLHDRMHVGDRLRASLPKGSFTLKEGNGPVILLAGGVGITPLLPMARAALEQGRETWLIQAARNGRQAAFEAELEAMRRDGLQWHRQFSRPEPGDHYEAAGRLGPEWLIRHLPVASAQVYICGPATFIEELYRGLAGRGVSEEQLHFETFARSPRLEQETPRRVSFRKSRVEATWTGGSLLELAEDSGLNPSSGCRSGSCGLCLTPVLSGRTVYKEPPLYAHDEGQALLCQARPAGESPLELAL